jgi:hypothetical protein
MLARAGSCEQRNPAQLSKETRVLFLTVNTLWLNSRETV